MTAIMTIHRSLLLSVAMWGLLATSASAEPEATQLSLQTRSFTLPLSFEANEGQADPRVRFVARHEGMVVFVTGDELVLKFRERPSRQLTLDVRGKLEQAKKERETPVTALRMKLRGARHDARVVGLDPLPGKVHYLVGNDPNKWRRNITHFKAVRIEEVYPGISLVLHGDKGRLEYDFEVEPGAEPDAIDLEFRGAREVSVSPEGDLVLKTELGEVRHGRPSAHEVIGEQSVPVATHFEQHGNTARLKTPGHDPSRRLVIDPTIIYEKSYGGSANDWVNDVAVDVDGAAYIVGATESSDLPCFAEGGSACPFQDAPLKDAFVAKLDSQGVLVYSTYMGGDSWDELNSLSIDDDQSVYFVGSTWSSDFPGLPQCGNCGEDGVLGRLQDDGSALLLTKRFGSNQGSHRLYGSALDSRDLLWFVGTSTGSGLACDRGFAGGTGTDAIVGFMDNAGSIYCSYLGDQDWDAAWDIVVDEADNASFAGQWGPGTSLEEFPDCVEGPGFVAQVNGQTGQIKMFCSNDWMQGLAVAPGGHVWTLGAAFDEVGYCSPTPDAAQHQYGGEWTDLCIREYDFTSQRTVYETFYGGPIVEGGDAIAVDRNGDVHIAFAIQATVHDPMDVAYVRLRKSQGFSGSMTWPMTVNHDVPEHLTTDPWGQIYISGYWNDDPNTNDQQIFYSDGFIIKMDGTFEDISPDCQDCEHDIGAPVNIYTGNVWLNQADVTIGGVMGIGFSRSYNSQGRREPIRTELGMGWTHTFDRSVALMPDGRLRFRQGTGAPMYFTGPGGAFPYTASAPASETSTFQKSGTNWIRTFKEGGFETYDDRGRLTSTQDIVGRTMSLTRAPGSMTVQDPGGRSLIFIYDAGGRLTELTSGGESLISYAYGRNGQLENVTYPDGTGYRYEYDERGQLLVMRDASGHEIETHTYDGDKAISSEIAGGLERYTISYEANRTLVTDAQNHTAIYEYQAVPVGGIKKVSKRSGPCATCGGQEIEEWTYTPEGRVETHKDGAGRIIKYTYETDGDLISETAGFGTPAARTTTYTWDAQSRPLTRVAPGESTVSTPQEWTDYVAAGPQTVRVPMDSTRTRTTTTVYNPTASRPDQPAGTISSVTDADGKQTEYEYFEGGVVDVVHGDLRWIEDARNYRTFFSYDLLGRRNAVTDALGNATQTEYDVRGRVTKVTQTVQQGGSPVTLETAFTYNNRGLKESAKDPEGRLTRYTYDDFGRLLSVIDDDGQTTNYTYDVMSRLTSITNAKGKTWTFTYDDYGRLQTTTWPGSPARTETLTYFGDGQVHTHTDRRGVVTTYTYDDLGRLKTKSYSDGTPTLTYAYDAAGRLNSIVEPAGSITRQYLLSGELSQETQTRGSTTGTFDYDYLLSGRRETVKLDGQTHLQYAYNGDVLLSLTHGTRVFSLGFDPASRRYVLAHPNNLLTEYKYDEANRLLSVKFGTGTVNTEGLSVTFVTVLGQTIYTYDNAGNRTSKTALDHAESYDYDDLHRLTSVSRTGAGARTWSYDYDEVGNRRGQVKGGLPAGGGQPTSAGALNVTYNDRNELQSYAAGGTLMVRGAISEPGTVGVWTAATGEVPARMVNQQQGVGFLFEGSVAISTGLNDFEIRARDTANHIRTNQYRVNVPADSASYTYDNNGNLQTKTEGSNVWAYEWTAENQLKRVTLNSAEVARFAYDPLGRRVEKVVGSITTSWLYDGDDILQETISGGSGAGTFRYIHGPGIDEPLARIANSGPSEVLSYYHADGLGSIIATTSQAGAIVSSRRYDAWGNLEVGASEPGYAFTGREWDPETGLYYYRARYYDPKIGRFISEDPIGFAGGDVNLYAYVFSNPARHRDATGLAVTPETVWDAANVVMDVTSLAANVAAGNWAGAAVDAGGLLLDAGATVVPIVPGGAGTAIKACRAAKAARLAKNKRKGDALRDAVAEALEKQGLRVRKEVPKDTPFGKRVIDIEVRRPDGTPLGGIETKAGGSPYTPAQRAKDAWLAMQGYLVDLVREP